jgi:hypothetical protein
MKLAVSRPAGQDGRVRARDLPFSAEAVEGWRAWSVVERDGEVSLSSLTRAEAWEPGAALNASCLRRRHHAPGRACSCGIYAAAEPEELAGLGRIAGAAVGQVSLWGRIAEHSRGYRAEMAYPARLRLVCVTCLAGGDGVPATKVDRDLASDRGHLTPLCDTHAGGRSLRSAADVERSLLARYQVEQVPDASVARIRRDPRIDDAERRSRRRVVAAVIVTLAVLASAAFAGELARERTNAQAASASTAGPTEIVKRPNDRTSDGEAVSTGVDVLRYVPRDGVSDTCGRIEATAVVATACDDPRAEISMSNISSIGAGHGGTVCDDATVVVTKLGDRVTCWQRLRMT